MTAPTADWPYPGARWWKCDFHVHSPASLDYHRSVVAPEDWLLACMRAGLDCVAVTDHNSGAWIDRLKSGLRELEKQRPEGYRPLHLFPGVELSVNGGFHLLAIFDFDTTSADIDTLLGAAKYDGTRGTSDAVTRESPIKVVEAILSAGAIPIPAHADGDKGLLQLAGGSGAGTKLDSKTVEQVLDCRQILAAEFIEMAAAKPHIYNERHLSWTEVLGSDSHELGNLGSRYTWVKMAKPSLGALRLALLDGAGYSIRRSDEPEGFDLFRLPTHCIDGILISNARYMGRGEPATFKFSPWLNALVGGRGTGKSTVIHALRLASRRASELKTLEENSEARLAFERFNRVPQNRLDRGGLTDETQVQWSVLRDGIRHRVHWRLDGSGVAVEDRSNEDGWTESPSQSVSPERFPIRIFSQGQIAALAGDDQQALMQVIDEAAGVSDAWKALEEARRAFYSTRARVRELDSKLSRRPEDLVVEQQDVERKLRRFEEDTYESILRDYRGRTRQRSEIDRQFSAVTAAAERIERSAGELQPEDVPIHLFDEALQEDKEAEQIIAALHKGTRATAEALQSAAQCLRTLVHQQRQSMGKTSWRHAARQATERYEKLVETLRSVGVEDPDEYGRLVQERRRLASEQEHLESEAEERNRLSRQAELELTEIRERRRRISDIRHDFLATALESNSFVRIGLKRYASDSRLMERQLREVLGVLDDRFRDDILSMEDGQPAKGIVTALTQDQPMEAEGGARNVESELESFKRELVAACQGDGKFGGHFNNYCEREFGQSPEFLDRLLSWFPEDGLSVEYSPKGDGEEFRPITQASAGQRAAAMLAFLLAHGDEPLVLDQPEDDLDNHLIYDLVVRQIREHKLRRQIIVVTHNANIVVNGDAEMVHALDFAGGQCLISQKGSLQDGAIRDEVCHVMEGGRDAFERRYRRLGAGPRVR